MRSLTLHSGKKWIQQTHDDYPLESSQKSHDITTNHMITPMPKTIFCKKNSGSTSCSNSTSNSYLRIDCTSHADARFQNFGAHNT